MALTALAGKTALVTGGAKRLGRATALAIAREGGHVVVHYSSSVDEADATCDEIARMGVRAWKLRADLGQAHEAEGLITRAVSLAGPVDMLVNNASVFDGSTLDEVTLAQVLENATVNAWAPFALSRGFAALGRPGHIVNLLDTRVAGYDPTHVAYILSKHMLAQLTRMCALEYGPDIQVNAVAPGLVLPPAGQTEAYLDGLSGGLPLKRHGDAGDVAQAVLFLLRSTFITGQVIYVDGGRHLRGD